jgi:hypothetical protein
VTELDLLNFRSLVIKEVTNSDYTFLLHNLLLIRSPISPKNESVVLIETILSLYTITNIFGCLGSKV